MPDGLWILTKYIFILGCVFFMLFQAVKRLEYKALPYRGSA